MFDILFNYWTLIKNVLKLVIDQITLSFNTKFRKLKQASKNLLNDIFYLGLRKFSKMNKSVLVWHAMESL